MNYKAYLIGVLSFGCDFSFEKKIIKKCVYDKIDLNTRSRNTSASVLVAMATAYERL